MPDAFIGESYHASVAALRIFRDRGIDIPGKCAYIGVDELPDYLTGGYNLTTIKISHTERAKLAMNILKHEIEAPSSFKTKLYTDCKFVIGDTV